MNKARWIVVGLFSLFYWFIPIIQNALFDNYLERTNDYQGVLYFPVMLFQGINMISPTLSYIIQFIGFVLTWLALSWLVKAVLSLFVKN
jgi:hypothetical protein